MPASWHCVLDLCLYWTCASTVVLRLLSAHCVVTLRFGAEAQKAPRYMGIPTFMRAPVVSVEEACAPSDGRPNGLDVAMIGTPRGGSAA